MHYISFRYISMEIIFIYGKNSAIYADWFIQYFNMLNSV